MRALAGGLALVLLGGGCASHLADRIVAPKAVPAFPAAAGIEARFAATSRRIALDNGVALRVRTIEPGDHGDDYRVTEHDGALRFALSFPRPAGSVLAARGDVVMLHGWGGQGLWMLPWAGALAREGFRVHLVDLRGHGDSDSAPVGYGTREADDIAWLVPRLGAAQAPIHLFGISYGATSALFAEPRLRGRVRSIVAIAPFVNAGEALRSAGNARAPRWLPAGTWPAAVARAGQRLGLDFDAIDLRPVVRDAGTCMLLLHGTDDALLPVQGARELARESSQVRYVELPGEGHESLALRSDRYGAAIARWLAQGDGTSCPDFELDGAGEPAATTR